MMKDIKELQTRRDFFKNTVKGVLPILGALAVANVPLIAVAAEKQKSPMGCDVCDGGCYDNCSVGCKSSCLGGCAGGCSGTCQGSCRNTCNTACYTTCKGNCVSSAGFGGGWY